MRDVSREGKHTRDLFHNINAVNNTDKKDHYKFVTLLHQTASKGAYDTFTKRTWQRSAKYTTSLCGLPILAYIRNGCLNNSF